jgi:hypothetical protein
VDKYYNNKNGVSCWHTFKEPGWVGQDSNFSIPSGFSGCIGKGEMFKRLPELHRATECGDIDDHWLGWAYDKLNIPVENVDPTVPWDHSTKNIYDHPPWFELRLHTNRQKEIRKCGKILQTDSSKKILGIKSVL